MVGHDGWGDARAGDFARSMVRMNDYRFIRELSGLDKPALRDRLQALGDEAGAHLTAALEAAAAEREEVVVLTHPPPFREACLYEGRMSGDEWAPHFTCVAAGRAIRTAAEHLPERRFTVLCGHTHSAGEVTAAAESSRVDRRRGVRAAGDPGEAGVPRVTLLLTEDDVRKSLDMRATIAAVEESLQQAAAGRVDVQPRRRVRAAGTVLHTMSASLEYASVLGWKQYVSTRNGAEFWLALYRQGEAPAASAVASRLAWPAANRRRQRRRGAPDDGRPPVATGAVRLRGNRRRPKRRRSAACARLLKCWFTRERTTAASASRERCRISMACPRRPLTTPRLAASCDVVVTVTTSGEPVQERDWLGEHALLCGVGANWPRRREIPADVVGAATQIVCDDDGAACRLEAGDLLLAEEVGVFDWGRAVDLAELVSGKTVGATSGVRFYKSVGSALFDVAAAAAAVERAAKLGLGARGRVVAIAAGRIGTNHRTASPWRSGAGGEPPCRRKQPKLAVRGTAPLTIPLQSTQDRDAPQATSTGVAGAGARFLSPLSRGRPLFLRRKRRRNAPPRHNDALQRISSTH